MELHQIAWDHPRRRVVEIVCKRHEQELLKAFHTLGIGCTGEKAYGYTACMRCVIEASGQEPRFAYGLTG